MRRPTAEVRAAIDRLSRDRMTDSLASMPRIANDVSLVAAWVADHLDALSGASSHRYGAIPAKGHPVAWRHDAGDRLGPRGLMDVADSPLQQTVYAMRPGDTADGYIAYCLGVVRRETDDPVVLANATKFFESAWYQVHGIFGTASPERPGDPIVPRKPT